MAAEWQDWPIKTLLYHQTSQVTQTLVLTINVPNAPPGLRVRVNLNLE